MECVDDHNNHADLGDNLVVLYPIGWDQPPKALHELTTNRSRRVLDGRGAKGCVGLSQIARSRRTTSLPG